MAKLSMWLPPFSPDYSGAAAVLFDLKTVTAMHDASGCTGNYTSYDEPRWYGSHSGIFCSGLRQIDAVLGDDDKLIAKMKAAAADLKPELMALIGSPVPMVIGADLKGIAAQLEAETGIPSFGFDTTGTAYYDRGAFMAAKALLTRFAERGERERGRVNLLGALPMDFGLGEEIKNLRAALERGGFRVGLSLAMDYTLGQLREAGRAGVNVAVSRFGWLIARFMEQRYGIPYLAGFPAGEALEEEWLAALHEVEESGRSRLLWQEAAPGGGAAEDAAGGEDGDAAPSALIIGEQVMANSLRMALQRERGFGPVRVGCLYGLEPALGNPGDLDLTEEGKIRYALNQRSYSLIVADPLLRPLIRPQEQTACFLPLAQYAVSSKVGLAQAACLEGKHFDGWFDQGIPSKNIEANGKNQKEDK